MKVRVTEHYFETLDSTNNEAKRFAMRGCSEGTVISAGRQTAGRGRRGRAWETPQDEAIATTMVLRPPLSPDKLSALTLVAAMAVRKTVYELYGLEGRIKWPNDIVLKNKKICGILTEMFLKDRMAEYVVVGIGINVHNRSFEAQLAEKAVSLDLALEEERCENNAMKREGVITDCKRIREKLWQEFLFYYEIFLSDGDLRRLKEEYNLWLINCGRRVRVLDPLGEWEGVAQGIDDEGRLLVETEQKTCVVEAGEVSVRGLYGYV